jgi:hypothetical protein
LVSVGVAKISVGNDVVEGTGTAGVADGTAGLVERMGVVAGAQEAKIIATSKTVTMFLIFINTFLCKELPN